MMIIMLQPRSRNQNNNPLGFLCLLLILLNSILFVFTEPTSSLVLNNGRRGKVRFLKVRPNSIPSSTPSSTTTFQLEESKRLLRLESASPVSYLYRYRAPRTTTVAVPQPPATQPTILAKPRVALRHNGYSGIIHRRSKVDTNVNPVPVLPSPNPNQIAITHSQKEVTFKNIVPEYKHADSPPEYPYYYYLDYDRKEALNPQPSEILKAADLLEQQTSLWNELFNLQSQDPSPSPTPPPSYLNEIINDDNYTIPSLRNYKFPDFKTTTPKPMKPDYLNPYEFFSEEDLENVADLDMYGDHSKFFVKTKPRDVSGTLSNPYNSFYYEPPSYSTKIQPLPVKTKHDELFVTYPMTATPNPTVTTPLTMSSSLPTLSTFIPPNTPNSNPLLQGLPRSENRQDPATAESIAIFSSTKSSNVNLNTIIPHLEIEGSLKTTTPPPISEFLQFTTPASTTQETTNIPGMPGIDYPIFDEIPTTTFNCTEQRYKGFFADIETKCQVWHYCDFADGQSSFICPNGTLFSQVLLTCDWWFNVDCHHAQQLYVLNERLYRYIKPPKPSFPEDYHGEEVDRWLKKQLELGLLPKLKKRGKNNKPIPTTLKEKVGPETTTSSSLTSHPPPTLESIMEPPM